MQIDRENVIFLLGGHDLEMVTIRQILSKEGIAYFDKGLEWGARLSEYADVMASNPDSSFYAVELIVDDEKLMQNYSIEVIDHHNEHVHKKASLLQVLELLGREPSRRERLIAANDVGHVAAMQCLGASDKEIEHIRKEERIAQGVTIEEDQQAQNDVEKAIVQKGVHLIATELGHFSPIVDRYDYRPLIVYSDHSLVCYGNIDRLKELYREEVKKHHAYFGKGYFGFTKEGIAHSGLQNLLSELVEVLSFYSYHAFMFPFRFDKNREGGDTIHERIGIDETFHEQLEKAGWHYEKFAPTSAPMYNEYSYFSEPVRDTLYNTHETFKEAETAYYYAKKPGANATYTIEVRTQEGVRSFSLDLTDVALRIFETGIGIVTFECENHRYGDFEDILKINDFGRRVYPQFLDDRGSGDFVCGTKSAFLAESIKIDLDNGFGSIKESFDGYDTIPTHIVIGRHILHTLGEDLFGEHDGALYRIAPVLDDRMFVLSYAENEALLSCLQQDEEQFKMNDEWYRYLFVDGGSKTVQYSPMQKRLVEEATYPRWLGWGTLWGITRYSLVVLTTSSGRELVLPHAQYIYHQMAILILATHASLARFGHEVSLLSSIKSGKREDTRIKELSAKVKRLYEYYIKFVNKLHFREITFQDQGIELYAIAKKLLHFDKEMQDLDNEIAELHNYIAMESERERNERLEKITKLGAVFLPPTLLAGILGMNSADYMSDSHAMIVSLIALVLSVVAGFVLAGNKIDKKIRWVIVTVLFVMVFVGTPIYLEKSSNSKIVKLQKGISEYLNILPIPDRKYPAPNQKGGEHASAQN
jgi:hypothetical protein